MLYFSLIQRLSNACTQYRHDKNSFLLSLSLPLSLSNLLPHAQHTHVAQCFGVATLECVSARNRLVSLLHPLPSLTLSALHPNFSRHLWFVLNVLSYAGSDYTTNIHMYMYWNSGGYIGNTRKNGGYNGCSWGPSWGFGVNFACGMRVLLVRVGVIVLQYA